MKKTDKNSRTFTLTDSEKLALVQADEIARGLEQQAASLRQQAEARRKGAADVVMRRCGVSLEESTQIEWKAKDGIPQAFTVKG